MEFVVSAAVHVAKLSIKCPLRGTNGASAYRCIGLKKTLLAPVPAVMQKGVQLMPPRRSSADILLVYLLFCLHLCIAKGTTVEPDSIHQGFLLTNGGTTSVLWAVVTAVRDQMFVYDVPLGSITCHSWMPNTSPICLGLADKRGRSWSFHVIISEGNCSQALMKCTNQNQGFVFCDALKKSRIKWRELSGKNQVFVKINILLACQKRSNLTFHGE